MNRAILRRLGTALCLLWTLSAISFGQKPTELYFVRHGETEANATGHYNSRTINTFSEKGQREVNALIGRMLQFFTDDVICSPSPRALRTAQPLLNAMHKPAEIWPEFNECCTQVGAARRIPAHKNPLRPVGKVRVPADLQRFFSVPAGHDQMIADGDYQDGLIQTRAAVTRFLSTYSHSGKSVLVIGHSGQGGRFLEMLLGDRPDGHIRPGNTSIYHLRQMRDKWVLVAVFDYTERRSR